MEEEDVNYEKLSATGGSGLLVTDIRRRYVLTY